MKLRSVAVMCAAALVLPVPSYGKTKLSKGEKQRVADELLGASGGGGASVGGGSGSGSKVLADFDDDGRDDLAVGIAREDVGAEGDAGAVQIFYGTKKGIKGNGSTFLTQNDVAAAVGGAEAGDLFGGSVAAGDFDGDGFTDLAVGAYGEDGQAGSVTILFGSGSGLSGSGGQYLLQDSVSGAHDIPESGDQFGASLAVGRFDSGRTDDLAIGAPREDDVENDSGRVSVIYGSSSGIKLTDGTALVQGSLVEGTPEQSDMFGWSLAAGNLGNGPRDDLVVGAVTEGFADGTSQGQIHVFYGRKVDLGGPTPFDGITLVGDQVFHQNSDGMRDVAENLDLFGYSLSVANFGRSSHDDIAVGVVLEGSVNTEIHGAVHTIFGSKNGVTSKGNQLLHQDTKGVPDKTDIQDLFGLDLAAGDFDNSGRADLAVGVPIETLGKGATALGSAGAVTVLYSNAKGLTGKGAQFWTQNSKDIADKSETADAFGISLIAGNFGRSASDDLAIGSFETLNDGTASEVARAGAMNVLYGTSNGLGRANDQLIHQNINGSTDPAEPQDQFSGPAQT